MAKRHDKKQEAARRMREQQAREKRQKQLKWGIGVVLAVVLVGALTATVLILNKGYPIHQPKAEATKSALVLTEKDKKPKVKLELYEDFICPACGSFQTEPVSETAPKTNGEAIEQAVQEGKVELKFHPLNFLSGASTTNYSLRAASAVTCAADEGKFFAYEKALFTNQPPEGGEGLSDKELIDLGEGEAVGMGDGFAKCVKDKRYYGWVNELTDKALAEGIESTPSVKLNGEMVESKNFTAAFDKALKAAYPDEKDDKKDEGKN